ncbi:glycosyltransferase family 4 protein [Carboxylicivirga taeanensis]|uniref:glycosyltransferase family 4 protein n=1 Tax=Carboxylicivirga taeanensis TaxID=1416875 RepID=UPI003F6E0E26
MENRKLKLVMVTENLGIGGKERRMLEIARGLIQFYNYQVTIIILRDCIQYDYIKDINVEVKVIKRKVKKDITVYGRLYKYLKAHQPDVIQAWGGMSAFYALPVARFMGVPTVNSMITNTKKPKVFSVLWLEKILTFPLSDIIMSNTKAGLATYSAPLGKSRFVHNGYDFARHHREIEEEKNRVTAQLKRKYKVVMIGALSARKDWAAFANLAAYVEKERGDVDFIGIGSGNEQQTATCKDYELMTPNLKFMGHINAVESLLKYFDLGILFTANGHSEGISNSILEYMAAGKPVIATKAMGNDEIIEDGVNGFKIEDNNITEAYKLLSRLLDNSELLAAMGDEAQKTVNEKFAYKRMIDEMHHIYSELIDS